MTTAKSPVNNTSPGRIVVTGAAGFIGSHLCERFVAEGYEVLGVDNLLTGRLANLDHLRHEPRFDLIQTDVIEPLDIKGPIDWILHFASPASPPKYMDAPLACLRVNSEGTRHLLELARERHASFVLASTSEVYGDPLVHPQPETYWGHVNPIGPRSMYDEAKRYAETMTRQYNRTYDLPVRIVRIFNTYGPRMAPEDGRVVSNFICQALRGESLSIYGDGRQTRSFQYVDDLVEGIFRLMRSDYTLPVNLGNPEEYSVKKLAEIIGHHLGQSPNLIFCELPGDDPRQRCPDIGLARKLLDWSPRVSLAEGLVPSIEYFRRELGLHPDTFYATQAR